MAVRCDRSPGAAHVKPGTSFFCIDKVVCIDKDITMYGYDWTIAGNISACRWQGRNIFYECLFLLLYKYLRVFLYFVNKNMLNS